MFTNPLAPVKVADDEAPKVLMPRGRPMNEEIAAWVLVGGLIAFVLVRHVVGAVIGGLLLYLILDLLAQWMSKRIPGIAARTTAVILVTLVGGGVIVGATALSMSFLRRHVDALPAMI